ncbi:MAG: redoxin domain-containing protein [Candidatus Marinimicrobia bacterium]|nr:redoxin domain-containing protein [Candidatus Neomarinimicrobiota bacterium]MCF7828867.1 redoxin domain-containing protein [Candidatus Neomarinimicrobiota bacterium]MCF7880785.1 redoxin domain-containing protein [Candidatus Neomarinimicrobiota bacterium]
MENMENSIDIAKNFNDHNVKPAGTPAPDFTLTDQNGEDVSLAHLLNRGMALLYFFSRDGAPGVSEELATLNEYRERFEDLGITPVGISEDGIETHKRYAQKNNISLTLLADPENEASEAYGTRFESGINARVSFVVSRDHEVVRVYADQRSRSHVKEVYRNVKETLAE